MPVPRADHTAPPTLPQKPPAPTARRTTGHTPRAAGTHSPGGGAPQLNSSCSTSSDFSGGKPGRCRL